MTRARGWFTGAAWLVLIGFNLTAACSFDATVPSRLKCSDDGDCPTGLRCLQGNLSGDAGAAALMLCCPSGGCGVTSSQNRDMAAAAPDADTALPAPDAEIGPPKTDGPSASRMDAAPPDGPASPVLDAPVSTPGDGPAKPDVVAAPDLAVIACTASMCPNRPNAISSCENGVCIYTCKPAFASCGVDLNLAGCPTPVANSPTNCGACGRACAGCFDGQCPIERLADNIGGTQLEGDLGAFDGKRLYFVSQATNTLMVAANTGAAAVAITRADDFEPRQPRIFGEYLYWHMGRPTRSILRMRLADVPNGPTETVVDGIVNPHYPGLYGMAVVGDEVYWSIGSSLGGKLKTIQRRALAQGTPVATILDVPEEMERLFFSPGGPFWDKSCCDQIVRHVEPAGMTAFDYFVKKDSPPTRVRLLGTDAAFVYWNEAVYAGGSLRRRRFSGTGEPESVVAQLPFELGDNAQIHFDRDNTLFVLDPAGDIAAVVQAGAYLRRIALDKTGLAAVGIDDTHVYWLNMAGTLSRTLK